MSDIETLRHIIGELNREMADKDKIIARLSKRDDELKERAEKAEALAKEAERSEVFYKIRCERLQIEQHNYRNMVKEQARMIKDGKA